MLLRGIKVVELGHVAATPAAAAMLSDWGADVIKVEPLTGDLFRGVKRSRGIELTKQYGKGEVNVFFDFFNRNKRSIAFNLTKPEGNEALHRLVEKADVFMTNYEPSVLEKFALQYEDLQKVNPRIIYASLTGYGKEGPDRDERGFDYTAFWARSGFQYSIGAEDSVPPQRGAMGDNITALGTVAGIMGALYHREKTGKGQEISQSLYQTGVWVLAFEIQCALFDVFLARDVRQSAANPLCNPYRTKDGKWFELFLLQADLYWPSLCRAIGKPELEKAPEFKDMVAREKNCRALIQILEDIFASRTWEQWKRLFKEHGVIAGKIQSPREVVNDPQAHENRFFPEVEHPIAGKIRVVGSPVKFSETPAQVRSAAPEVGQHTEEILLEVGYTWEDIVRLKEVGAIL